MHSTKHALMSLLSTPLLMNSKRVQHPKMVILGEYCSLEDLVTGAWEAQERLDCLADGADHPKGLQRGLATMSAVAQQRSKLQVHVDIPMLGLLVGTEALLMRCDGIEACLCCLSVLRISLCFLWISFLLSPAFLLDI